LPTRGVGRSSHRPPETREDHAALDDVNHLGNAQGVRVIGDDGPLLVKAHLHLGGSMEPLQGSLDPAGSAGADHPRDSDLRSKVSHRPDQPFRFDQPSPGSDSQIPQPHMIASDEGHRCSHYSSRSAASGQRESIPVFRFPDHPWTRRGMSRVSRIPERFSPDLSPRSPQRTQSHTG